MREAYTQFTLFNLSTMKKQCLISYLYLYLLSLSLSLYFSDSCYVSKVLASLKTVRYTKHTCTIAELQVLARYIKSLQIKFFSNQHSAEIHRFTLGYTEIS